MGQPSLPAPEGALAGQEPVAQKTEAVPYAFAFDEVAIVADQHVVDVVRVVQEVGSHVHEAQTDDVAVLPGAPGQEAEVVPGVI